MVSCEMCGNIAELYKAIIEGTELNVCESCARFGKVIGKVSFPVDKTVRKAGLKEAPEIVESVVPDFAERIKRRRQELGLRQDEFGKLVSVKESLVHKIETGQFEPTMETARKLEKVLKIKLVETYEEEGLAKDSPKTSQFTIGDAVKVKKR